MQSFSYLVLRLHSQEVTLCAGKLAKGRRKGSCPMDSKKQLEQVGSKVIEAGMTREIYLGYIGEYSEA